MTVKTKKIRLTKNAFALVDEGDFMYLNQFRWYLFTGGYAVRDVLDNGKKRHIFMHRVIMGDPVGLEVDHKDRNGLNNRRGNLRTATSSNNKHNQGLRSTNTSGYKGVYFCKQTRRWRAEIMLERKKICLGRFDTLEQARYAYDAAAIRLHGDFAVLNKEQIR